MSEVTDVINGKKVLGRAKDILEVKNAVRAYNMIESINPYSISDLLRVHKVMMEGLVNNPGEFRVGGVGVFKGDTCIHMAPPAKFVAGQIKDLLAWCQTSNVYPLIKSSVFHFEFEFIHPFEDWNGRMGRLWQTLILSRWEPVFLWIPIESLVLSRQDEYYSALNTCGSCGNSDVFIEFMLKIIDEGLIQKQNDTVNDTVNGMDAEYLSDTERAVISCIRVLPTITVLEMAEQTGYSRPTITRALSSLKKRGILRRDGSDKKGVWVIQIPDVNQN